MKETITNTNLVYFSFFLKKRGVGVGGGLLGAGRSFTPYGMGTYLRWALIRGWVLNRISTYLFTTFSVGSTFSKSTSNQTRVVTKISSCRVNTTSRRGIKRLGISFGSIFQ